METRCIKQTPSEELEDGSTQGNLALTADDRLAIKNLKERYNNGYCRHL